MLAVLIMAHDIGIAKYHLADNIKQEYEKFEQVIRFEYTLYEAEPG